MIENGILDVLILMLPVAVLGVLGGLLFLKRRRAHSARHVPRAETGERAERGNEAAMVGVFSHHAASTARAHAKLVPTPAPELSFSELQSALQQAKVSEDAGRQAELHLQIADAHLNSADHAARLASLRSAAGLASLANAHGVHASARLQLAEAAFEAGDRTEACEQWQLARTSLLASGQRAEHDRLDERMRANGCPTDWVLTDF